MKFGVYFLIAGIYLGACSYAVADQSIYDVVNDEDTASFSDMVVLGYDIDEPDGDGFTPLMARLNLFDSWLITAQISIVAVIMGQQLCTEPLRRAIMT